MKEEKLKRYIICIKDKNGHEFELINEYGFFRFEYEAKLKSELLGGKYYYKVYYL